ncbi:WD repeat-containing protein 62 isoform X2 [Melanotaenia boesemani]|uniref:WD repeat-containing protein 62 isoform X2 n=1 Tax=Melanotaenia boesemani TaxID=1250792 RepID=UPI001C04413B|nr:WD repeat-containing protein 62 isoform X2 [Melanotaenia boesemani]
MAEGADCGSVNAAKRRQPAGRKSRQSQQKTSSSRVILEKVLGISTVSSSGLTSDPNSGLIAYPAGCVIVLLQPKKNKQSHIINTSRKPFTALAFSQDGKHLVTGESGHMPCVRVWEVGGGLVAEVQSHKYGVSCVAFSSNGCYIVSVGYQHDMTVSVWDWRKGSIIASNKVSSRVVSVSFSQDSSYFVTAGNRHVKFWYLDASKERRVNSTVPLIGRSGLLDDHKNSVFSGVACGRGLRAANTYCITSSGLLCLFNSSRHLEAWVNLKTSSASCLAVSEDFIFCGCAAGVIRVFSPSGLQYITTLPRPHRLGVDVTQSGTPSPAGPGDQYPDTLALTFDPAGRQLTCVYSDHSVYVWDVTDVRRVGKTYSALYHSSGVWSIQVYPELQDPGRACLPPSSFLTCSSDNTIRLWHAEPPAGHQNLYSNDLIRILYMGEAAGADGKAGIRVLGISPDGQHLAAGDRCGNLRIFGLEFLDELVKIEAHDSEVLCLEFSPSSTGVKLLASASRDRLIHVFNLDKNFSLEQTLNDHSSSITAVRFTGENPEVRMVSCGADKSIYFQASEGLSFSRRHHVVEKTTLYDMDLDSSRTHVVVACQDRNVRVYDVETGKMKKCLKGSSSDDGALLKVQMDPSGSFFATSCSDKNITVFDYESGECVATLFGHSEIVTCMRFSPDCRHLISVSGDSCVFVWRLDSHMTTTMRKRRGLRSTCRPETCKQPNIRRETFITGPSSQLLQTEEEEQEVADHGTPARPDLEPAAPPLQTNGKLPLWFRKLQGHGDTSSIVQPNGEPQQVRSRWAEQVNPLTICSSFSPSPTRSKEEEEDEDFHPQSLESLLGDEELEEEEQTAGEGHQTFILHPEDRDFCVDPHQSLTQLEVRGQGAEPVCSTQLSPDSACSEGSTGSLEQQHDADTDSLSQGSSVGSLGLEDDEDRNSLKDYFDTLASSLSEERFDTDLRTLQPPEEKHFLNPRLSISTRFLSRFQDRLRAKQTRAPPPATVSSRISEESILSNVLVTSESSSNVSSAALTRAGSPGSVQRYRSTRTSCGISHQPQRSTPRRRRTVVVVKCRRTLGDVTSSSQQVDSQLRHLEPPPSPKLSHSLPTFVTTTSTQEENKENLPSSSSDVLHPSAGPDLQTRKPDESISLQVATPTQVTSQGRTTTWSISSTGETPTNQNQTLIQCPAPSPLPTTPALTGVDETRIQRDPDVSSAADLLPSAPPTCSSSPISHRLRPLPTDDSTWTTDPGPDEDQVSIQQCQQVANELRQSVRRAVLLYSQLGGLERHLQKSSILEEAFAIVDSELQAVLQAPGGRGPGHAPSGQLEDEGTKSLLEKYSDLLVQITQNKLNRI